MPSIRNTNKLALLVGMQSDLKFFKSGSGIFLSNMNRKVRNLFSI